jgi:hypothetical protein
MLHNGDGRGWKRVAGVGEKLLRVLHVIIHRMQQHFAGTDESLHQVRLHRWQNEHEAAAAAFSAASCLISRATCDGCSFFCGLE